jgi:hypothetical protein
MRLFNDWFCILSIQDKSYNRTFHKVYQRNRLSQKPFSENRGRRLGGSSAADYNTWAGMAF